MSCHWLVTGHPSPAFSAKNQLALFRDSSPSEISMADYSTFKSNVVKSERGKGARFNMELSSTGHSMRAPRKQVPAERSEWRTWRLGSGLARALQLGQPKPVVQKVSEVRETGFCILVPNGDLELDDSGLAQADIKMSCKLS
ncbi:hypothetical protein OIU74_004108 [Salix koriyanagi]|uniref:Uncharacterized protein n=1 Tax=Salix koriyanagi TaxID=2511006 RepID=A0A9Q0UZC5_9ROSI|nr:hypothetical protein OIU74_004108 [Salix koriyanagi]